MYLVIHDIQAEFINLQLYASEYGHSSACEKANEYLAIEKNLWVKSYYLSRSKRCYTKTDEFKQFSLSKKRKLGEENVQALEDMRRSAFDRGDIPPINLLSFISISGEKYPHIYEYLEKLRIESYLDKGCEVEDHSHNDCHSPLGFVKADFMEMIYNYKINDREEDVNRLYQEYLKHPYGGEAMISSLKKDVEKLYINHLEEQQLKSTNEAEKKKIVVPKQVAAKLQEAINSYDEAKAKVHANSSEVADKKGSNYIDTHTRHPY